MANVLNVKGTSFPSFGIGKNGVTIFQGTGIPAGTSGVDGDLYIRANGGSSELYQKAGGTWNSLVNANLTNLGNLSPGSNNIIIGDGTTWTTQSGSTARASLGVAIGTDVQAYDADLDNIAGLSHTAGNVIRSNGTQWQSTTISLDDLGDAVISSPVADQYLRYDGTNWINETVSAGAGDVVGPVSSTNLAIARFDGTTGKIIQNSVVSINGTGDILGYNTLGTPGDAVTTRANLGLAIGTNVQAFDADLSTIAGLSQGTNFVIRSNGTTWQSGTLNINQLAQVVITSPSANQFLRYNGTNWINQTVTVGTGDTVGVASVAAYSLMRSNNTNGRSIQASGVQVDLNTTINVTKGSLTTRSEHLLYNTTTTATPANLFQNGTAGEVSVWGVDVTMTFDIMVTARRTDVDNESASWRFFGTIDRNATAATTAFVGTPEKVANKDTAASAWDCNVLADTATGALRVQVTGEAGKTIRWAASVNTLSVTG